MFFARRPIILMCIATLICASFSCSYRQQQSLFDEKTGTGPVSKDLTDFRGHRIAVQDLLQIRNLQNRNYISNEALSHSTAGIAGNEGQNYLVEADSTIALPMLGHVKVVGLSRSEAANKIELLYRKELKDPIIELKIINLKVTLLGEVKNQGSYGLVKDQTSLIEIIGQAGGLTEKANSGKVKIIRGNLQQQVIEVDLGDIRSLSDTRTLLQNNDIIYVAQNKKAIRTEKLQSMSALLQPVMLLLNTALIIFTLSR